MQRNLMTRALALSFSALAFAAASSAQAHFQVLYPSAHLLDEPAKVELRLVFGHPLDNGHVMEMGEPVDFFVAFRGQRTDLKGALEPITWKGPENQARGYRVSHQVTRNGDYIFALVPAPYYEATEDAFIQQITKTYLNKGGMPTDWNEPLGLPAEIVPMNMPTQVLAGGTFTGQVLTEGKPAAGIECEVEFINTEVDIANNAFGQGTLVEPPSMPIVTFTDANGFFTFGIPRPGIWGFACLGAGPETEYEGKELSQDAVLWVQAIELK
ncbi:DUF4198 domain-containing protein [Thioalkalicoccus limnaeus]|uniref:DUF4198 domain-containing protein n=1 Tax=Thioalkalicoccus limnaeus TaxID=120681 RepID=A0ABV4BFZ6_9GAMM